MEQKKFAAGLAAVISMALVSGVEADHESKRFTQTEVLTYQAKDLKNQLRADYRRSRLFGKLMSASARIKGTSFAIRNKARSSAANCGIGRDIARLGDQICELESLLAEADRRAALGIDPPVCGNRYAVARQIAEVRRSIRIISRSFRAPVVTPRTLPRELDVAPGEWLPPAVEPGPRDSSRYRRGNPAVSYRPVSVDPPGDILFDLRTEGFDHETGGALTIDYPRFDETCSIGRFRYGDHCR